MSESMELLYIWINMDETGFIREQGFNFSPNYKFELKAVQGDGCYELSCIRDPYYPDIWNNGSITGLTALVGENGSGKTSILRHLLHSSLYPLGGEKRTEYASLQEYKNAKHRTIQVYRLNDTICIYHNFSANEFRNNTPFDVVNMNLEEYNTVHSSLDHQTRIFMSNGYAFSSLQSKSKLRVNEISFSPIENNALSKEFFLKLAAKSVFTKSDRFMCELQEEIIQTKTYKDFEQLLAVFYFNDLFSKKCLANSVIKGARKFTVKMMNLTHRLRNRFPGIGTEEFFPHNDYYSMLSNCIRTFEDARTVLAYDISVYPIAIAYLHLIFELVFLTRHGVDFFDVGTIKAIEPLSSIAEDLLKIYQNSDDYREEVYSYYHQAFNEISELRDILEKCSPAANMVPPGDLAYKTGMVIYRDGNPVEYERFCKYIDKLMRQKKSFILKYIVVDMPPLSSGEQALLNIFSWLSLPPHYKQIFSTNSVRIHDNILLLLDEVDLFMHPEWQRQFLKLLSEELTREYPQKRIQLVLSTHSPLILSDIPTGNVTYLEKNDQRCTIAQGPRMKESFGANIFSLLKDSFFLKKSLGDYAHFQIEQIIKDLQDLKNNPEVAHLREKCRGYDRLINIIGEPVIRRKLQMLYDDVFANDSIECDDRLFAALREKLNSEDPSERTRYHEMLEKMLSSANGD